MHSNVEAFSTQAIQPGVAGRKGMVYFCIEADAGMIVGHTGFFCLQINRNCEKGENEK